MKVTIIKQEIKRFKNQTVALLDVGLNSNGVIIDKINVVGIANCCPEDKYDFNIGKRIALARAEIKVFKYFKPYLENTAEVYNKIAEDSKILAIKLEKQIAHNEAYINKIVSGGNS